MILFQHRIFRCDLQSNPAALYVFGDNERRYGKGGQAYEMRGEPNAVGVATLAAPGEFWSDAGFHHNRAVLDKDFARLFEAARAGVTIVLPRDGIGTGLAQMEIRAPRTFAYLQTLWNDLIAKVSQ